jgi:hypothetical protein
MSDERAFDRKEAYETMKMFDELFSSGKFNEADNILTSFDFENKSIGQIVNFVISTYPAQNKLKNRPAFIIKAREAIHKMDPERSERLFKNLAFRNL